MDDQNQQLQQSSPQPNTPFPTTNLPQSSQMPTHIYKKASFFERLLASLIDGLVLLIILLLLYLSFKTQISELNILSSVLSAIYSIFFVWKKGATPGKILMKIKVVANTFQVLSFWQTVLRESLGKTISGLLFNLGYFWVLIDKKNQAWHDKIAKSFVVKLDDAGNLITLANEEPITRRRKVTFAILYLTFGLPLVAATIFLIVYIFFFRPFQVTGEAMSPTYKSNEYLMASAIHFRNNDPQRGDVIVFHAPTDPDKDFIKRIIGLPGETVMLKANKVYIDNNELDESAYLSSNVTILDGSFLKEGVEITVPEDNYFVLGDNRPFSSDSREWGFVSKEKIIGKVLFCYYNCSTKN